MKEIVERWFKIAKVGNLVLPSGYFGRPYDNCHQLTFTLQRPHQYFLELDSQLMLVFFDLKSVRIENSELVLSEYKQMVFYWQEYDSMNPHAVLFDNDCVKMIPPIGIYIDP